MKIIKAESAGFCFGVKRAVDTVYKCTETGTNEKIYTYGPIIHNEEVVKDMEKRGVRVIRSEEDLAALKEGTVIIRSHGVEKRVYEELEKKGIPICERFRLRASPASLQGIRNKPFFNAGCGICSRNLR